MGRRRPAERSLDVPQHVLLDFRQPRPARTRLISATTNEAVDHVRPRVAALVSLPRSYARGTRVDGSEGIVARCRAVVDGRLAGVSGHSLIGMARTAGSLVPRARQCQTELAPQPRGACQARCSTRSRTPHAFRRAFCLVKAYPVAASRVDLGATLFEAERARTSTPQSGRERRAAENQRVLSSVAGAHRGYCEEEEELTLSCVFCTQRARPEARVPQAGRGREPTRWICACL